MNESHEWIIGQGKAWAKQSLIKFLKKSALWSFHIANEAESGPSRISASDRRISNRTVELSSKLSRMVISYSNWSKELNAAKSWLWRIAPFVYLCVYDSQKHTATHCNTLQHTATHCKHTATHCNTLQYTATHCNTLQQAQKDFLRVIDARVNESCTAESTEVQWYVAVCYSVLQCVAVCCSVLQCVTVVWREVIWLL